MLLDYENDISILMAIGDVIYRRFAIRDLEYSNIIYKDRIMLSKDFKKILKTLDNEVKIWLKKVGKYHLYEKRESKQIPNVELREIINELETVLKDVASIDFFSVKKESNLNEEIEDLMKKNKKKK